MMAGMTGRTRVWIGAGIALAVLVGLAAYLVSVGLDKADKWASVIGVFVALIGLGMALTGGRDAGGHDDNGADGGGQKPPGGAVASGERSVAISGDNPGIVSTGDDSTNTMSG